VVLCFESGAFDQMLGWPHPIKNSQYASAYR